MEEEATTTLKVTVIVTVVVLIAALAGMGSYALQVRDDLRVARERLADLAADNAELAATNDKLTGDLAGVERELRELIAQLRVLRGERGLLLRDLKELRAQLADVPTGPITADCGDVVDIGAGAYGVTAQDVDCSTALTVARLWQERCFFRPCDEATPINGYLCHIENVATEVVRVTCTDPSGRLVRFEAGS